MREIAPGQKTNFIAFLQLLATAAHGAEMIDKDLYSLISMILGSSFFATLALKARRWRNARISGGSRLAILVLLGLSLGYSAPARAEISVDVTEPCTTKSGAPLKNLASVVVRIFEAGTNVQVLQHDVPDAEGCGTPRTVTVPFDLSGREGASFDAYASAVDADGFVGDPSPMVTFTVPDPPAEHVEIRVCLRQGDREICFQAVQQQE